jgi:hypothetical protein
MVDDPVERTQLVGLALFPGVVASVGKLDVAGLVDQNDLLEIGDRVLLQVIPQYFPSDDAPSQIHDQLMSLPFADLRHNFLGQGADIVGRRGIHVKASPLDQRIRVLVRVEPQSKLLLCRQR